MQTEIKKWGNSAAVRLPAKALAQAGLDISSSIEIVVLDGEIILKPVKQSGEYSLDDLLAVSPESAFELDDADNAWIGDKPKGKEHL